MAETRTLNLDWIVTQLEAAIDSGVPLLKALDFVKYQAELVFPDGCDEGVSLADFIETLSEEEAEAIVEVGKMPDYDDPIVYGSFAGGVGPV